MTLLWCVQLWVVRTPGLWSALTLLVARVLADHHDAAVATDHLALVTDRLDARVDLHGRSSLLVGWSPRGSARGGVSLVPVDDATTGQVVGRELHDDPVLRKDPDVVLAHLAADVREHLVAVAQLDSEHRVGKGFHDGALHLDDAFLLRHVLRNPLIDSYRVGPRTAPHTRHTVVRCGSGGWTSWSRPHSSFPREAGSREAARHRPTLGRPGSLDDN